MAALENGGGIAAQLLAPRSGFRVYFMDEQYGHKKIFHLWYSSLKAAKTARRMMKHPAIAIVSSEGLVV